MLHIYYICTDMVSRKGKYLCILFSAVVLCVLCLTETAACAQARHAVIVGTYVLEVYVACTQRVALLSDAFHLNTHGLKKFQQVYHVDNFGYIVYCDLFGSKERSADYLQGFVLGALRYYFAFQAVAALYYEFWHICGFSVWLAL